MKNEKKIVDRISFTSIIVNFFLFLLKLFSGIIFGSSSMISDAVHSLSDVLCSFVALFGFRLSRHEADNKHPYGHERFENIVAILLSFILFGVSFMLGISGMNDILYGKENVAPSFFAIITVIISILIKEWMYWYTMSGAKKVNSDVLKADAWHHRTDSFSSIGSLIGIVGSRLGFFFFDSLASIIIALFILRISINIFRTAMTKLIDQSIPLEEISLIEKVILEEPLVRKIDSLKTRMFGNRIYVDIEFSLDKKMTLEEISIISDKIKDNVEKNNPLVKYCMIHVNPC